MEQRNNLEIQKKKSSFDQMLKIHTIMNVYKDHKILT